MLRPLLLVLVAAVFWGTTGTAAFYLGADVSPLSIGAATMGIGGVILAALGGGHTRRVIQDRSSVLWWLLGSVGVVVYPLTFYWGMSQAGIAVGNVIALGLGPITVAVLEWALGKTRPATIWWISSGIALAGIALMASAKVELGGGRPGDLPLGIALAVIAGVSYGLFTYAFGRLIDRGHHPRGVIGAVFGAGSIPLLVVLGFTGAGLVATLPQVGIVTYLVLGPMVIAYLAFSRALVALRSSTVATIALAEPVVAALLAVVVVGERLGPLAVAGGILVLAAIALLGRSDGAREATQT